MTTVYITEYIRKYLFINQRSYIKKEYFSFLLNKNKHTQASTGKWITGKVMMIKIDPDT